MPHVSTPIKLPSLRRTLRGPAAHPDYRRQRNRAKVQDDDFYVSEFPAMSRLLNLWTPWLVAAGRLGSVRPEGAHDFCMAWIRACASTRTVTPNGGLPVRTLLSCARDHLTDGEQKPLEEWENTAFVLCRVMMNGGDRSTLKKTGQRLMYTLSSAGSAVATVRVLASVCRTAEKDHAVLRRPEIQGILTDLKKIVAKAERDVKAKRDLKDEEYQALVLEGKLQDLQGKRQRALSLWWDAMAAATARFESRHKLKEANAQDQDPFEDVRSVGHLSTPWNLLAVAHNQLAHSYTVARDYEQADRQMRSAIDANKQGCDLDDPNAHFLRAEYFESDWDWDLDMAKSYNPTYLYHMTKAAASGHLHAAYRLAQFYFQSTWPYFKDDPPDAIKPTPFDRRPAHPGVSKRSPTPAEELYFTAVHPSSVLLRYQLAVQWLSIAVDFYHAPAYLLTVDLFLTKTVSAAVESPAAALRLSDSRYAVNDKDNIDYDAMVSNPAYQPETAREFIAYLCAAIASVKWELSESKTGRRRRDESESAKLRSLRHHGAEEDDFEADVARVRPGVRPGALSRNWFRFPEVRRSWIEKSDFLEREVVRICAEQDWAEVRIDGHLVFGDGNVKAGVFLE